MTKKYYEEEIRRAVRSAFKTRTIPTSQELFIETVIDHLSDSETFLGWTIEPVDEKDIPVIKREPEPDNRAWKMTKGDHVRFVLLEYFSKKLFETETGKKIMENLKLVKQLVDAVSDAQRAALKGQGTTTAEKKARVACERLLKALGTPYEDVDIDKVLSGCTLV